MKVQIMQADFAETAFGYNPNAGYAPVWEEEVAGLPEPTSFAESVADRMRLLESVFARFQWVDEEQRPPDGYTGRSLSVGDVVALDGVWYAVEPTGFAPVESAAGYGFGLRDRSLRGRARRALRTLTSRCDAAKRGVS